MQKLTKIRKWASDNGYTVKDFTYWITIQVSDELSFQASERESTVYQSIRGKRGNPKGVYLATNRGNSRFGHAFHYPSQTAIVERMEEEIRSLNRTKTGQI